MVELRQVGSCEVFGHVGADGLRLDVVAQELVIQVTRDTCVIHCEGAHRRLHAVEGGRLPNELNLEAVVDVPRSHLLGPPELQGHLFVGGDLGDVAHGAPAGLIGPGQIGVGRGVQPQAQLVARHQPRLAILLGEVEVSDPLLVETNIPSNDNVLLRLGLLHLLVVVGLHLHQWGEDVLVLIRILVPQHHRLWVVFHAWTRLALQVFDGGIWVALPHLF
mmetsp:Transcript_35592/g.85274  ORF Transcript_35592/g.85274 Transcript_35592/m.85274 type:complete len:219 (+) Transcript_35592:2026-2682(+)